MATTRVRKAFKYPDEDDIDPDEGIDEEGLSLSSGTCFSNADPPPEQDKLISSLTSKDAAQTELYLKIFLVLPAITAIFYIPSLLSTPSARLFAQSLFCISSLSSTALTLFRQGPLHDLRELSGNSSDALSYMPLLNAVLSGVLALQSVVSKRGPQLWPPAWVPAAVFWLILAVRYMLRPVDVEGLEKLRYGYKGA